MQKVKLTLSRKSHKNEINKQAQHNRAYLLDHARKSDNSPGFIGASGHFEMQPMFRQFILRFFFQMRFYAQLDIIESTQRFVNKFSMLLENPNSAMLCVLWQEKRISGKLDLLSLENKSKKNLIWKHKMCTFSNRFFFTNESQRCYNQYDDYLYIGENRNSNLNLLSAI